MGIDHSPSGIVREGASPDATSNRVYVVGALPPQPPRFEDDEPGPDALDRLDQALAVRAMVEAQRRHVDDGDVEGLEAGAGGDRDTLEPGTHDVAGVFGGEQQDGSCLAGGEGPACFKPGRRVRYPKADREAWAQVRRRRSTSGDGLSKVAQLGPSPNSPRNHGPVDGPRSSPGAGIR